MSHYESYTTITNAEHRRLQNAAKQAEQERTLRERAVREAKEREAQLRANYDANIAAANTRINNLTSEMQSEFGRLSVQLASNMRDEARRLDSRIDQNTAQIDAMGRRIDTLDTRVNRIQATLQTMVAKERNRRALAEARIADLSAMHQQASSIAERLGIKDDGIARMQSDIDLARNNISNGNFEAAIANTEAHLHENVMLISMLLYEDERNITLRHEATQLGSQLLSAFDSYDGYALDVPHEGGTVERLDCDIPTWLSRTNPETGKQSDPFSEARAEVQRIQTELAGEENISNERLESIINTYERTNHDLNYTDPQTNETSGWVTDARNERLRVAAAQNTAERIDAAYAARNWTVIERYDAENGEIPPSRIYEDSMGNQVMVTVTDSTTDDMPVRVMVDCGDAEDTESTRSLLNMTLGILQDEEIISVSNTTEPSLNCSGTLEEYRNTTAEAHCATRERRLRSKA